MDDVVLLKWKFDPSNYFEDEIRINHKDYEMVIKNGVVEARVNPEVYDQNMRETLHQSLDSRFLGVQILSHKPYELSKSTMCRLHPDGRKDVTIYPESIVMTTAVGNVDVIITDKDGKIVSDSRKDRIEKKKGLAELAQLRSSDSVAASLLVSNKAAVNDPENELVHLYEILDALSTKFASVSSACKELGLASSKWSKLGRLANNEPLKQGRHRGKKAGQLRDASEAELIEARNIASSFVEAYLCYLDNKT